MPATNNPATTTGSPAAALQKLVDTKLGQTNNQIKTMLHGMIDRAEGKEEKVRAELATWFDNAMDRVGGAYKRWTQVWSFVFALIFAVLLNVSTTEIAQTLWRHPVDTTIVTAMDPSKSKISKM